MTTTGTNIGSYINAPVTNQGLFDLNQNLTIVNAGKTFSQTSGTVDIEAGRTFSISGGTFDWQGGTIQNTGILNLSGAVFSMGGAGTRVLDGPTISGNNVTLGGGSLEVKSGTFSAFGTTNISGGATLQLTGGTFNPTGQLNNDGLIDLDVGSLSLGSGGTHTQVLLIWMRVRH